MNTYAHRTVALNVDDDEAGRYAVSRVLKQADFEVIDAATGHDALRLSIERKPDVVLLDVKLPDIAGFEVCRRLRSDPRTSGIPVLHVSATFLDDMSRVQGLDGGADGYLTKPIDPLVLIASIKALLRVREAEKRVRESAREWQSTFESIRDGIAIFDSQGRMLQSNGRFREIFKSADPLPGAPLSQLLGAGKVAKGFLDLIRTRQRVAWEQSHGERTLAITFDPFEDDGDAPPRMVCIVSDISERKQMENRLQHTQKLESLGLLAGGVAHDFNNILTGILCNASFALECLDSPDKLGELLPEIVTASRRAANLVRQLLAYAGGGRMTVQPVDLSQVIRDTVPLIRTSIGKMVTMSLQLDESLPAVRSDATQLQQLAMNLIINAGEAIGDSPGSITVVTRSLDLDPVSASAMFPGQPLSPGLYVSLEVSDTGCGMDRSVRSRIFDPFFTTKFFGRGLGLSAAVGIIRAHDGAIHVESEPGSGSRFHIVLPATAETVPKAPVERTPHPTGRGTILLVDDEEIVRKVGAAILEKYGYTVLLAADGLEGVKLFEQYRDSITLVVLDLTMPVMSGEEAIPLLQNLDPGVKILVSTGHSESMVAAKLRSQGVLDTLQKPFTARSLVEKISYYDVDSPAARLQSGQ